MKEHKVGDKVQVLGFWFEITECNEKHSFTELIPTTPPKGESNEAR